MSKGGGAPSLMMTPSSNTTSNNLPQWVIDAGKANYEAAANMTPEAFAPYSWNYAAPLNGMQNSIIQSLMNNIGSSNGAFQNASNIAQNAYGLGANQLNSAVGSANGVGSAINGLQGQVGQVYKDINLGPNPAQSAMNWLMQATSYKPDQVSAQSLPQGDLSAYMNPYTKSVIDASLATMDQQKQQDLNKSASNALSQGAYSGSRSAIQDAVLQSQYGMNAGNLAANLNNQNFGQAVSSLQNDQARRLQADLANQSAGLQNLGMGINAATNSGQLGLTNQGQNLQAQQYNNSNALANQQNNISALQSAGQLGINQGNLLNNIGQFQSNYGLNQAGVLGNLANSQQQNYLNSLNAGMTGANLAYQNQQDLINADRQKYLDWQQSMIAPLNLKMQALGMTPYNTSTTSSGWSTSPYQPTKSSPLMSILGGGLSLLGNAYMPGGGNVLGGLLGKML